MNGVINIYKEAGYSSFHVIYVLRKLTGEQKIGHTGTLDPEVKGVLPVCIGKATKLVGQLTDTDKIYRCVMFLGKSTDTQDVHGKTVSEMEPARVRELLTEYGTTDPMLKITSVLNSFTGEIMQIPPMFSALKVGGMKLVNAARKGVEIERKPRCVTVYSIDHISLSEDLAYVSFDVKCSKGTYIRTLCKDAGEKMGIPCCLYELERTCAAGLTKDSAVTLDQVRESWDDGTIDRYVIPVDSFLKMYPALTIKDTIKKKVIYGNEFSINDVEHTEKPENSETGIFRIYDREGEFYALYRSEPGNRMFKCVKMFRDL